jgi:hypothetical protein
MFFECITRIALTHGTIKRLTKKLYKLIVQFLFLDFVALRGKTQHLFKRLKFYVKTLALRFMLCYNVDAKTI